jgi:hypothetical protein
MAALAFCVLGGWASAASASADLCVGNQPGCFMTIQAAIAAAADGDAIHVAPGTYSGPITIDKSVRLVGSGAAATIIRGGGPVVTVRITADASTENVAIDGVTITGGVTHVNQVDPAHSGAAAAGGGVSVLPRPGGGTGATVSITDSVISDNSAAPVRIDPDPCGPGGPHCFSNAAGGGVSNAGALTLRDTSVTGNLAGDPDGGPAMTVSAFGGGIENAVVGTLTLEDCVLSDNHARASATFAEEAHGGGIDNRGTLDVSNSLVTGNGVELSSSLPGSIADGTDAIAEAGGIKITPSGVATIANSTIAGNTANAANTGGDVTADSGGIDTAGTLTLNNSHVDGNQARSSVPPGSGLGALAIGGGLEVDDSPTTINNSSVDGNSLGADSQSGVAAVLGAGIAHVIGNTLALHRSDVSANTATARGAFGFADGGGIFNSLGPVQLTLVASTLTNDSLTAGPGITPLGGGLFTADVFSLQPILATVIHTQITGNQPDQCFGC